MMEGSLYGRLRLARQARRTGGVFALASILTLLLLVTSTEAQEASKPAATAEGETIVGEEIPYGEGMARSWVRLDEDGYPSAVGLTLTEAALSGLPEELPEGVEGMEAILSLPADIPMMPFDHIGLDWGPYGHPPEGIYNLPHFDVHFYMISQEARDKITAEGEDRERCSRPPEDGYLPEGYVYAPESEVPRMGGHWVDPESHEFHGQPFTSTFLYGTYDGEVIFYEPMITKAYLDTKPDEVVPLKLPAEYAREGYYPTEFIIRYDVEQSEYTVALEGMRPQAMSAAR